MAEAIETTKDVGRGPEATVRLWLMELKLSDKAEEDWREDAKRAVGMYRDEARKRTEYSGRHFNILYSNTQTLAPAIYNNTPRPDVRRRFRDADPIGKEIATILERSLSYSTDAYDFDHEVEAVVQDYLLTGRGVLRVTYTPYLGDDERLDYEEVGCECVPWNDFRISPAKSWRKVRWEAFRHRFTRDELVDEFGAVGREVPLDWTPQGADGKENEDIADAFKRATVWEIWDKAKRQVIFIAESFKDKPLRVDDDPLRLVDFFPTPRPIYSIQSTDSLVPKPEYTVYEDQAKELDDVTQRIGRLTKALKARGAYNGHLGQLLTRIQDADDGEMIASEDLGLDFDFNRAVWFYPLEIIAAVLERLYANREQIKQTIYEITGIADILRGATKASETATAQQIKANFGTLRLERRQAEVQRLIRDTMRLKAEIVAERFSPQILSMMTGVQLPTEADKQLAATQNQPIEKPSWKAVLEVMRRDGSRGFRVDIETDNTIAGDEEADKRNITELLGGITQLVNGWAPYVEPQGPIPLQVVVSILLAVIRKFKLGREVEDAINELIPADGEDRPPPPPSPEAQAAQAEMEARQQEMAMKQQEMQAKMQADQQKAQLELQKAQADLQIKGAELQLKQQEIQLKSAEMQQRAQMEQARFEDERVARDTQRVDQFMAGRDAQEGADQGIEQIAALIRQQTETLLGAIQNDSVRPSG